MIVVVGESAQVAGRAKNLDGVTESIWMQNDLWPNWQERLLVGVTTLLKVSCELICGIPWGLGFPRGCNLGGKPLANHGTQ